MVRQEPHESFLHEHDARKVIRLLGEVAITEGDHQAKKRILLDGLAELVQADVWSWALVRSCDARFSRTPVAYNIVHSCREGIGDWLSVYMQRPMASDFEVVFNQPLRALALRGHHFTRTRRQILSDDQWYGSEVYQRYYASIGIDDFIYSICPLGEGAASCINFYRTTGAPRYTDRDRVIVHLVVSEVSWLHQAGTDVPGAAPAGELSPRRNQVLLLLLNGDSRKQIAYKLGLSPHTVDDYIKQLYQHFGVQSSGELFAQFLAGDAARYRGPARHRRLSEPAGR